MDEQNCILKFEQRNDTLFMGSGHDDFMILPPIEGLTDFPFDVQTTSNPQIYGVTIDYMKPLERKIRVVFRCKAMLRQRMIHFFNPFISGKLTVTWNGVTRWINYVSRPIKINQPRPHNPLTVEVELMCRNPYWNHMDDYGKNIAAVQPLIVFPFVWPVEQAGYITDYKLLNQKVEILNDGDVSTPIRVIFRCKGEVINPRLTLNDQEYVRIGTATNPVVMQLGDTVEFDTNPEAIEVLKNGVNIFQFVDPTNTYFQVPPGDNYIEYGADDGVNNLEVFVYLTPRDSYI